MNSKSMTIGGSLNLIKSVIIEDIETSEIWIDSDHKRAIHIDRDELVKILDKRFTQALREFEKIQERE